MKRMWTIAFAITIGCGGEMSPREACEQSASVACERLYACFTAAELAAASFPPSEAGCVTVFQAQYGCAARTVQNSCDGNAQWHASDAEVCIDQVQGLECSQIRASNFDVESQAPACDRVCRVD